MNTGTYAVGVDACPAGWFATAYSGRECTTELFGEFSELIQHYDDAERILVDIPIGLPVNRRRRCDESAKTILGCRGLSVFYTPCEDAIQLDTYEDANRKQKAQTGQGLSQQAFAIRDKILEVGDIVGEDYNGRIRESHPELCFYALNGQPVAYPKSSDQGRSMRLRLLEEEIDGAEDVYEDVLSETLRKEVGRDDILDSMALAVAAQSEKLGTVPEHPESDEPRIYYPREM